MQFDPLKHHRRSIRLRGYDYSRPGAYFVTVNLQKPAGLSFGRIQNDEMHLNEFGNRVMHVWENLPNHYPTLKLDAFVVMPDHVHGVFILTGAMASTAVGVRLNRTPTNRTPAFTHPENPIMKRRPKLGEIIHALKTFSARKINESRGMMGIRIWQRDFYEHIVRNTDELGRIRQYIHENPIKWKGN